MEKSIEWIILITDKYQKAVKFYKDILGFKIDREMPGDEYCQFKLKDFYFALYGRKEAEKLFDKKYLSKPGGAIYTLPESKDIDKTFEELKSNGVIFIKNPTTQPWGQRTAYFTDPDGHIWEIQQWIKN